MSEYHFPVPGHEEDKIVIFTRRHIMSMLGTLLLTVAMFLVPLIILVAIFITNRNILTGLTLNFLAVGGSIYYLVAITFAFTEWISYYYDIFIVTQDEIIDINQSGIFDRTVTEVTLLRVQDVSARIKGFLPTIFSYGDVVAESAGENTRTYVIDNIPNPVEVANQILDMHNEHVAREERVREIVTAEGDLRHGKMEPAQQIQGEFQQAIQKEMQQAQSQPPPPASTPPPTPAPVSPPAQSIPEEPPAQGEIKKDDLNEGGEVKF